MLQYPRRHWPTELRSYAEYPRLSAVFREYGEWLSLLGVDDLGSLDDAIEKGNIQEIILVAEALHEDRIAQISHNILKQVSLFSSIHLPEQLLCFFHDIHFTSPVFAATLTIHHSASIFARYLEF